MQADFDWTVFIGIFSFGLPLFILLSLIIQKRANFIEHWITCSLLLILAFNVAHDTLIQSRLLLYFPHFLYLGESLNFLIWPLIYLHLRHSETGAPTRWLDVIHFLPFIVFNSYRIPLYETSFNDKLSIIEQFYVSIAQQESLYYPWSLRHFFHDFILWRLQGIIYLVVIYNGIISSKKPGKTLINNVVFGLASIFIIRYGIHMLNHFLPLPIEFHNQIEIVLNGCFIFLVSLWAVKPYRSERTREKYSGSPLNTAFKNKTSERLNKLFETEKLFLEKGITLKEIAQRLDTNSKYLSQVINEVYHTNFTQVLNKHRVEEMIIRLQKEEFDKLKIEAIAIGCGFNSITTCVRAFRTITGHSPSYYRKRTVNS